MATLTEALEFANQFKALIKEAEEVGLRIGIDRQGEYTEVDLYLGRGVYVDTIVSVDL